MIHYANGGVESEIYRPDVRGLTVETVVEELSADICRETEIVAEVVFENNSKTDAGHDVERVWSLQEVIRIIVRGR